MKCKNRFGEIALIAILLLSSCKQKTDRIGRFVSKEEFGDKWVFSVDSGYVYSLENKSAIFRVGDKKYGLNGRAIDHGLTDIHQIWVKEIVGSNRDGSSAFAYRGDVSLFIDLALENRLR
jgi:hypothetical protein